MSDKAETGRFTGWHMTMILVAFFGVVIAVNFTMAFFASRTFGGLVVENSYVASQEFNGWLEKAREEQSLGWTLDTVRSANGRLDLQLGDGKAPLEGAEVTALVRHPLGREPERNLSFVNQGAGRYESREALPDGRWIIHLRVRAQGHVINRIVDLQ